MTSVGAFLYFYRGGSILLYGDAVAHINIARRVLDSMTPGPLQLGTVWLPLPHLLNLPFLVSDWAWRTGVGGSIASMIAYVFGAGGIFRLVEALMASRTAAWTAALFYVFNPNLMYMQATAMTESVYLAAFVWSVVHLAEFAQAVRAEREEEAPEALTKCTLALSAAMLTRYDGWFLAVFVGLATLAVYYSSHGLIQRRLREPLRNFVLLTALIPALWLAYNYGVFGNALEFANGPYSARAIAARSARAGGAPHPGDHHIGIAYTYFVKSAKQNVGEDPWQHLLMLLAVVAAIPAAFQRNFRLAMLLWLPVPFYVLSIAYGGVPVFLPVWWPFSYYNVRYGLQMLPALAVFFAILFEFVRSAPVLRRYAGAVTLVSLTMIAMSYASAWRATPICLREARVNARTRLEFEGALAEQLSRLPGRAKLLMYTGNYSGALQRSGISYGRVVYEGNKAAWRAALSMPARAADYVVAIDGDPVAEAVNRHSGGLQPIATVETAEKPKAVIYQSLDTGAH